MHRLYLEFPQNVTRLSTVFGLTLELTYPERRSVLPPVVLGLRLDLVVVQQARRRGRGVRGGRHQRGRGRERRGRGGGLHAHRLLGVAPEVVAAHDADAVDDDFIGVARFLVLPVRVDPLRRRRLPSAGSTLGRRGSFRFSLRFVV